MNARTGWIARKVCVHRVGVYAGFAGTITRPVRHAPGSAARKGRIAGISKRWVRHATCSDMPSMTTSSVLRFDDPDLQTTLEKLSPSAFDALTFGVIGFGSDPHASVLRYNAFESNRSGLAPTRVIGLPLFSVVAQCMNNYLIAQRFEDAKADATRLDTTLDYVLTLRMRPTHVRLRLLALPDLPTRYVVIDWKV